LQVARAESSVIESGFLLFELCNSSRVRGTKFGSREVSVFFSPISFFFSFFPLHAVRKMLRRK
jgi:hypothetical protein